MIQNARDWLPVAALATPAIRSAFDAVVDGWSARWFGNRPVAISDLRQRAARPGMSGAKEDWYCFAPGLFLNWSEATQHAVARHGLHAEFHAAVTSEEDKKLLTAFAEKIAVDLVEDLACILGIKRNEALWPGHPYERDGGVEFRLTCANGTVALGLAVSAPALVGLRKGHCPTLKSEPMEPICVMDALGEAGVPFRAFLGKARMTAHDLTHLAPEDVVVLDTSLDAPIVLTAEVSNRVLCATVLGRDGDELSLQVIEFEGIAG